MKRSSEMNTRIQPVEDQELLGDFTESASGCLTKLREGLTTCEKPMILTAEMMARETKFARMGSRRGVELIETMFGRDRRRRRSLEDREVRTSCSALEFRGSIQTGKVSRSGQN